MTGLVSDAQVRRRRSRWIDAFLFGPAAAWTLVAVGGMASTLTDGDAWGPVDRRQSSVQGSDDCRRCHSAPYASWHRSYHRTMTQRAEGAAVLAPFEGETVDVLGFRATMDRAPSGRPRMRIMAANQDQAAAPLLDAEVELTVGSHRYQQYVARIDTGAGALERWRLPMAWHVAEQRWIHLSGAFLVPDGTTGNPADVLRFMARWNDNCIFCHNTEPVPGLRPDGELRSEVGELGIACEACHGPASAHVQRHGPFRRLLAGVLARDGDATVAHPGRLDAGRHSQVCGRCHGQRIGHDLGGVMAEGDGFLPGTDLAEVSRPIFRDTRLATDPRDAQPFAERFWPDGTPRLSAYEYQALLLSPCHADGEGLGCGDCHAMHGSDPDMQLRDAYDEARVCSTCHPTQMLPGAALAGGHGGHGDAVPCGGCHMPRITYGLLEGMITHRIASPDPGALLGRDDQPDACTQCHVDRSRAWAAASMAGLGLQGTFAGVPGSRETWASRVELDLFGGDPIQRALAAHALGRRDAVGSAPARMATLVDVLEDEVAVVRWFALRALRSLARMRTDLDAERLLADYDYLGDPADRIEVAARLRAHLGPGSFAAHPERLEDLQRTRDDRAIEIGE